MSAVDVLAVMDAYSNVPCTWGRNHDRDEIAESRAAVVELIEASDDVAKYGLGTASAERLRAALARVGGES